MLKFSADVKVNRPVEEVFAQLTNAEISSQFAQLPQLIENDIPE